MTTHTTVESPSPLHQCVEGGYDHTPNSGVSIRVSKVSLVFMRPIITSPIFVHWVAL